MAHRRRALAVGRRLSRAKRRDRTRAELDRVGLANVDVDRLSGTLSVGQRQRVAHVRALIPRPVLVVADEPTASLDVHAAAAVVRLLRTAADDGGAAILVVSHDETRLASYADRLVRMRDGVLAGPGFAHRGSAQPTGTRALLERRVLNQTPRHFDQILIQPGHRRRCAQDP